MTGEELLDALFAAITARDLDAVAELYDPDMLFWTNASGHTLDREGSLRVLRSFLRRVTSARYEVLERRHWEGGAMQRHLLIVRVGDGDHEIDVCIVFGFHAGRISRIWEYVDGRALAPLGW
ncbi:MAG TPA: nuclear transport factor 2 family protein [Solirubrobacteraceae bacterium]|nr:nuclear transport factor 2 family protein [Solirubrobacteraceae bacterium]